LLFGPQPVEHPPSGVDVYSFINKSGIRNSAAADWSCEAWDELARAVAALRLRVRAWAGR